VHPIDVLDAIADVFGDGVVLVSDCGTPTPFIASHWLTRGEGRDLIVARGHGPMGYAIPAGVAAAIARPGEPVVVLTTDGSLGMACGELETYVRLGLDVTLVQLTNGSYGWIKMLQELYHGGRHFSVDIGPIDAAGLAGAMGMSGARVSSRDELVGELERARARGGPCYVEVMIPDEIACPPPVASWQAALSGADRSRPVY
jgi:acetolactate synthase-1/2/3 large subunit